METVDILIIGASFAGVTLGHHLPSDLKTVILDRKTRLYVEHFYSLTNLDLKVLLQ
jgi:2-polyprenyl-6-methoxyphenol hydroxylase-like FAD-dependent oxidoreductase